MNYWIQDNFIFTKNSIIIIFEIEPIDVVLLPEYEQESFFNELHRALNSIGMEHIQFLMRTRKAQPHDLKKHFRNIITQDIKFKSSKTQEIRNTLAQKYMKELSSLLENNIIPVKEYYLVIDEKVNTQKTQKILSAVKNLERKTQRITGNLRRAGIKTYHLTNYTQGDKDQVVKHKKLKNLLNSFVRL